MALALRTFALGGALALCAIPAAVAAPFRGEATLGVPKKGEGVSTVRARAVQVARRVALEAALTEVGGTIAPGARRALLANSDGWTGSYRVLSAADSPVVQLEVDVDLVRLRKFLLTPTPVSNRPGLTIESVDVGDGCVEGRGLQLAVKSGLAELASAGSSGPKLRVHLSCVALGVVPYTFLHASRLEVTAQVEGRQVAQAQADGFAEDPAAAQATALASALSELRPALAATRQGGIHLRIAHPVAAVLVGRLERTLTRSVAGVRKAEVEAVDRQGRVTFRVIGPPSAIDLAAALEVVDVPGLQLSGVRALEGSDAVVVELH